MENVSRSVSESEDEVIAISSHKSAKLVVKKEKSEVSNRSEEEKEQSDVSMSERDNESSY